MRRRSRLVAGLAGIATMIAVAALLAPEPGPERSTTIEVAPLRRPAEPDLGPGPAAGSTTASPTVLDPPAGPRDRPVSDALVRGLVETLSDHPMLASWLATDGLLRRFAAAVEAVAGGYSPRESLRPLAPHRGFVVARSGDELVVAASSYRRYDLVADVVGSLDADRAVEVYLRLEPQIADAHRRIAWYRDDVRTRLLAAIDHLLEVEPPSGEVAVQRGTLTYAFADPALEALTDAQRQLLRMGPRNVRVIQDKLRELRATLLSRTSPESMADDRLASVDGGEPDRVPSGPGGASPMAAQSTR